VSEVAQVGQRSVTNVIRHRVACLLVVVFSSGGCGTSPPAAPTSDYAVPRAGGSVAVSGRVVDFTTDAAIAGATVEFGGLDFSGRFVPAVTAVSDGTGAYKATIVAGTSTVVEIDKARIGQVQVNQDYRGDFLVRFGSCVARYGTVADGLTLRPITGATVTVSGRSVVTAAGGWYRIDLGCPSNGLDSTRHSCPCLTPTTRHGPLWRAAACSASLGWTFPSRNAIFRVAATR
jgi:hypothetical protein